MLKWVMEHDSNMKISPLHNATTIPNSYNTNSPPWKSPNGITIQKCRSPLSRWPLHFVWMFITKPKNDVDAGFWEPGRMSIDCCRSTTLSGKYFWIYKQRSVNVISVANNSIHYTPSLVSNHTHQTDHWWDQLYLHTWPVAQQSQMEDVVCDSLVPDQDILVVALVIGALANFFKDWCNWELLLLSSPSLNTYHIWCNVKHWNSLMHAVQHVLQQVYIVAVVPCAASEYSNNVL